MISNSDSNKLSINQEITVFLPMRKGSIRVPGKNIMKFGKYNLGLTELKLNQLIALRNIENIVISTDCPEIVKYATSLRSEKINFFPRPIELFGNIDTDDLVNYVVNNLDFKHLLWTHVTSPFFTTNSYEKFISKYFEVIKSSDHDSLVSVDRLQTFIFDQFGKPIFDRITKRWPRTQTLDPLFAINSAAFLASKEVCLKFNDRLGSNPYFYESTYLESVDVDTKEQFEFASLIADLIT